MTTSLEKVDPAAQRTKYTGSGTANDPFVVDWDLKDPENPYNWFKFKKWIITAQVLHPVIILFFTTTFSYLQLAICTWTVSFSSSSYAGGFQYTAHDLNISYDVAIVGISIYVLGFALG